MGLHRFETNLSNPMSTKPRETRRWIDLVWERPQGNRPDLKCCYPPTNQNTERISTQQSSISIIHKQPQSEGGAGGLILSFLLFTQQHVTISLLCHSSQINDHKLLQLFIRKVNLFQAIFWTSRHMVSESVWRLPRLWCPLVVVLWRSPLLPLTSSSARPLSYCLK